MADAAPEFRRQLAIIAAAHVALLIALFAWSKWQPRKVATPIVWMNSGDFAGAGPAEPEVDEPEPEAEPPPPAPEPPPEVPPDLPPPPPPPPPAPSEIVLRKATPTPATPKPATPKPATPKPQATPKPATPKKTTFKATPRKTTPKATPKPASPKPKASPAKTTPKPASPKPKATPAEKPKASPAPEKPEATAAAKPAASGSGAGSAAAAGKGAGSGAGKSDFGWYYEMLHSRFHPIWVQPTSIIRDERAYVTTLKIRIGKDGSVLSREIVRSSGNSIMDESVLTAAQKVRMVDPLPAGLGGETFEININFQLDQK